MNFRAQNIFTVVREEPMNKVALVTDSTACIPKEYLERYRITVVPQALIWGEETLEDGVDILPGEFYTRMAASKTMPTTSQVSVLNMQKAFSGLLEEGYEVLGMFISSKLSGTLQSAMQGRASLERGLEKIQIHDTNSTVMAMGFQVLAVARAAADGASMAECQALAEHAKATTNVYFVVDTLEYLHRGGRIGGAARFFGTALNLKPILKLNDGRVESAERVRTKSKAIDRMVALIVEQCQGKKSGRLASLHANAPAEAKDAVERAARLLDVTEIIPSELSPVVGNHTGPGTVGIAYMAGL